ncbi:MAG: DUF262 domain-containing protein [Chloroflexi bacterium]|nr:DUF262 domain-containing protein [Chloroflexota bacterium]
MHTRKVTLSDILSSQRQHIIPVFQRPYSWTKKNWEELWSDIQSLVNEGDNSPEHFLGPMIIDRGDTGSYVPEKYLVIDGQQRLVTLSVLLCALRDIARKHEIEHFASSVEEFLAFKTTEGKPERRLLPRSADRSAFEKIIDGSSTALENKQPIVKAYRFFLTRVRAELRTGERETFAYLNDLFTVIVARLKFVSITLEDSDDPTKIYESMNFKGKVLLVADLIRNYVLMHLPNGDNQDAFFNEEWEPFEKLFTDNDRDQPDSKELEDFYYRYLIAQRDYFAKRLVYSKYKDHLKDFLEDTKSKEKNTEATEAKSDSLRRLLDDQKRYATYYLRIIHPHRENDQELKAAFERFGYLDARTATPLLMSLYARYDNDADTGHISKRTFLKMTNAMESFIIRRSVLRLRTRGYGLDFAQAVRKSESLQGLWDHFDGRDWPEDSTIEETLVEFPLYLRERKKARLILEQLENSFGHKEQVDLSDPDKIQIEHILPQKKELSPEWKEMLGEDAFKIHERYRDTLGNLTLTGYNQELGAKSFPEKKKEYAKHGSGSHLELNTYVLAQDQWTVEEIRERAKLLSERVIQIWPRPDKPQQTES